MLHMENKIYQNEQITWKKFESHSFSIYIPEGWSIKSISNDESQIVLMPIGNSETEIAITAWYFINKATMTATECLPIMMKYFKRNYYLKTGRFPDIRYNDSSDFAPENYKNISYDFYNLDLEENDIIYVQNTRDDTLGKYHNFSILTNLISSKEKFSNLRYLAAQLIGSFSPNENWLTKIKNDIDYGLKQRLHLTDAIIKKILVSIKSNYETIRTDLTHYYIYDQIRSDILTMFDIKKLFWIHFLGLTKYMKDPITGIIHDVDNRYNYYYINSNGNIIGSKNPKKDENMNELDILNPYIY